MKPHIFILLAVLVLLGMIASPVCAEAGYATTGDFDFFKVTERESMSGLDSYTYNAAPLGHAINKIQFTVDTGNYVNFTLYYGQNLSVEGSAENTLGLDLCYGYIPCPMTTSIVCLNGNCDSYSYGDIEPFFDFYIAGYARNISNNQTGFLVYDGQYGNSFGNDLASFYPVSNIPGNLIYRIDIDGSQTFSLYVDHGKASDVANLASKSWWDIAQEWIGIASALSGQVIGFVTLIIALINFFFIENLLLVIALYLGVSMAYSAVSSRNIFQFYKKFFNFQKSMLNFMISLWDIVVRTVGSLVQMFVKWL